MELSAIYENGRLHFAGPFRLKMKWIPVKIMVDDDAVLKLDIESSQELKGKEEPSAVLQRIHRSLGSDYEYIPTEKTDNEMLLEALKEKYAE